MKPNVTSLHVARLAQVSQSAVSRTYTPGASVSDITRDRVLDAAQKLGYRPNAIARSLITKRSRIIGVVMSRLDNQFYPLVLEKLPKRLREDGLHVLLFISDSGESDDVLAEILQYQVDGIVMVSTELSSALARDCANAGSPVVLFNRTTRQDAHEQHPASAVTSDNEAGARMMARHLVAGGHQRIAYIAGTEESSTNVDRERGFREELALLGKRIHARAVGHYSFESAKLAARELFSNPADRPDAVFVGSDHMALAVMDVLRIELGLRIPEDVSVAGFDNVPQAAWGAYQLTTVEQPVDLMIEATATMLREQLEGGIKPHAVTVPCALVLRASTRKEYPQGAFMKPGPAPFPVAASSTAVHGSSTMKGFDAEFNDLDQYIRVITDRIWEGRRLGDIHTYYSDPCVVETAMSVSTSVQEVIKGTEATLAMFPDRRLLAEDVIVSGDATGGYLSSHRIISPMTHAGDGSFGPATGRKIHARTIADCVCRNNRIVHEWLVRDHAAIALQIGSTPQALAQRWLNERGGWHKPVARPAPDGYVSCISSDPLAASYALAVQSFAHSRGHATTTYDDAVQHIGPGEHTRYGQAEIAVFWQGLWGALHPVDFAVEHLAMQRGNGRADRVALRFRAHTLHQPTSQCTLPGATQRFGLATGRPVEVLGIIHAEFYQGRVIREWVLIDEVALWMQILSPQI